MEWKGKRVLVVGLGETGWAVAKCLKNKGAQVTITEKNSSPLMQEKARCLREEGVEVELGCHKESSVKNCDLVVPSPGVPADSLPLKLAKTLKKPVLSEIEVAFRLSPSKKIIAVTGTNGKTTTSSLLGFLLHKAKLPYLVCGNIGNPFIGELNNLTSATWVVLEVSSFQLEYVEEFKPQIGILLNVTADHLDRYSTMEEYFQAKARLFFRQQMDDWAVLNYDDFFCQSLRERISARKIFFSLETRNEGLWYQDQEVRSSLKGKEEKVCSLKDAVLFGKGNLQNMLAVTAVGTILNLGRGILEETFQQFQPLPHRMEKVAQIDGICFVNDSKATNVDSVKKALETFPDRSVILIMGGKDKGFSFSELQDLIRKKVSYLLVLGETAKKISEQLGDCGVPIAFVSSLVEAVKTGYQKARAGQTVLLSPGCSSFDMFTNYKERGDVFKNAVKALR